MQEITCRHDLLARDGVSNPVFSNMSADIVTDSVTTVLPGAGGAAGMEKIHWFVAVVRHNTEKSAAEKLEKTGYRCYVPVQEEVRVWKNGRRATVERVVIPSVVFVNCTEEVRKEIVRLPYISRFMTDKAGTPTATGHKPFASIPDMQIDRLKFMLGNSDTPVMFSPAPYRRGDVVRVIRGRLLGLVGEIQHIDDRHSELTVRLDCLGNARLAIETINVEPVSRMPG